MVEFSRYIVDERGAFWTLGDDFKRHIGTVRSDADLASYCVTKLGYIVIDVKASRAIFVNFCEDIVAPVALISVMQWMHDQPDGRFVFNQGGINKKPLLVPSLAHARRRLGDLIQAASPAYEFETVELAADASPFRKVWRVAQEIHLADDMPTAMKVRLFDKLFDGRFTLSERDDSTGDFNITAVGTSILHDQFVDCDRYSTFRDMHDREYGEWIANGLMQLRAGGQPIFQLVTAPLKFPDRPIRELHRYSRLLFAPNVQGRQRLLTASVVC